MGSCSEKKNEGGSQGNFGLERKERVGKKRGETTKKKGLIGGGGKAWYFEKAAGIHKAKSFTGNPKNQKEK